jgi:hypothetical protein
LSLAIIGSIVGVAVLLFAGRKYMMRDDEEKYRSSTLDSRGHYSMHMLCNYMSTDVKLC